MALGPAVGLGAFAVGGARAFWLFTGAGVAVSAAGLLSFRWRALPRWLVVGAAVAVVVGAFGELRRSPLLTLLVGGALMLLLAAAWASPSANGRAASRGQRSDAALSGAVVGALVTWLLSEAVARHGSGRVAVLVGAALAWPLMVAAHSALVGDPAPRSRRVLVVGIVAAGGVSGVLLLPRPPAIWVLVAAVVGVGIVARGLHRSQSPAPGEPVYVIAERPAALLVGGFAALCLVGAVLLALPESAGAGQAVSLIDAAFTSVSAVCVTGLVVLDTPRDFSTTGQIFILVLIQVGGLGIMGLHAFALQAIGWRLSLRQELRVHGALGLSQRDRLGAALSRIVAVTIGAELLGALGLAACFARHGDGLGMAVWRGVFTAISAFCNAGFALQTDNLIGYRHDPGVLHLTAALIVAGGLSPAVVLDIPAALRRRLLPLQTRLVLVSSAWLLVGGTLAYLACEWSASLATLSIADKVHNSLFQSATTRTAGFNSVDLGATRPATRVVLIALMLIGGSPGSTAGGLKTTTVAVLLLAVRAALTGKKRPAAFGRRLSSAALLKAAAVATVGLTTVLAALVALLLTQDLDLDRAAFEVVSALGTVGLSLGATSELDSVGKLLVMVVMFIGRVGPLTLFLFLAGRAPPVRVDDPVADVETG